MIIFVRDIHMCDETAAIANLTAHVRNVDRFPSRR
jgi:hypothetical protein